MRSKLLNLADEFLKLTKKATHKHPENFNKIIEKLKIKKDSFIRSGMEDMWKEDILPVYEALAAGEEYDGVPFEETANNFYPGWTKENFQDMVKILKEYHSHKIGKLKHPQLTKKADQSYTDLDKIEVLLNNIKQLEHQLINSGLSEHSNLKAAKFVSAAIKHLNSAKIEMMSAKYSLKQETTKIANHKNCNCENIHCSHKDSPCKNPVGVRKSIDVGAICDSCADNLPSMYLLNDEFGNPISTEERINPRRHFKERLELDPDEIDPEEIHPDFQDFNQEDEFDDFELTNKLNNKLNDKIGLN